MFMSPPILGYLLLPVLCLVSRVVELNAAHFLSKNKLPGIQASVGIEKVSAYQTPDIDSWELPVVQSKHLLRRSLPSRRRVPGDTTRDRRYALDNSIRVKRQDQGAASRERRETTDAPPSYVFPKYTTNDVAMVLGTIFVIIILFLIGFLVITYCVYKNEQREEAEEAEGQEEVDPHCAIPYPDGTVFLVKHVETGPGKFLVVRTEQ